MSRLKWSRWCPLGVVFLELNPGHFWRQALRNLPEWACSRDSRGEAAFQHLSGERAFRADHQSVPLKAHRGRILEPGIKIWFRNLYLEVAEGRAPQLLRV